MPINFAGWLGDSTAISESERAALAWSRIQDKPETIVLKPTTGASRASQIVRVESDNSASPAESAAGASPRRKVIVFGVRNHATLANTVMVEGDRFVLNNDVLRCVDTILTLGEIQGIFEAVG